WGALFVVLAVEALEFLFIDPTNRFGARTWTWMGWTAFTFFWLFLELSLLFHNQGRIRRELVLNEQEKYQTGMHWIVLLRNIRNHRSAWYGIWIPVWIAIPVFLFLAGWLVRLVASFPRVLVSGFADARAFIDPPLNFSAPLPDPVLAALPLWLDRGREIARDNALLAFAWLIGTWLVLRALRYALMRVRLRRLSQVPQIASWIPVVLTVFALLSTRAFDWLVPFY